MIIYRFKFQARPRVAAELVSRGCLLTSLLPTRTGHWWPMIEDIFNRPPVVRTMHAIETFYCTNKEYESISIDATVKCCMAVLGQESYRCNAERRNAAPFGDDTAFRRVLTVRGKTSAVLAMVPISSEQADEVALALAQCLSADALRQIRWVASDNASLKLYSALSRIMPNLHGLALDPIHLCIVYESLD